MNNYKFWTILAVTALLGVLTQLFLPWWTLAVLAGLITFLLAQKNSMDFGAGFFGGIIAWGVHALIQSLANGGILADRVGGILGGLPGEVVILITAIFGGLLAGLGAMTGSQLKLLTTNS